MSAGPYQESKAWIVDTAGLARDALHVHIGLGVMIATALILRCDLRSRLPLLMAVLAAISGEVWDAVELARSSGGFDLAEHLKDLASTIFWPTTLMLLARHTQLFGAAPEQAGDADPSGDSGEQPFE